MTTPDSGTGPIEQDINQAVDAGNLAPTTEIPGNGTPPAQSAQNIPQGPASVGVTPAPNAPNAPNSRPAQGPQVQPQGPSAQPNQPQKPPSLRSHIFDTILKVGAGQPVQGPDGDFIYGPENKDGGRFRNKSTMIIYKTTPYHSWEKGTVENTIGLVREYLPKGMDLTNVSQQDLMVIGSSLNDRPRKRLGYRTPNEVLLKEAGWCITS